MMADDKADQADKQAETKTAGRSLAATRARDTLARTVWIVCVTLALILAAAAFSYALEANEDNGLVQAGAGPGQHLRPRLLRP
ncbi:hypothetical protein G5V59_25995 [Nocardioides sp. W3-2-3]|uniref:hypothetical protein n=1 Tax=Nocardioides convexus TaxID=2712224 RepID=UPI00241841A6|nr:hypothetical protein [Nocardioides convexus]NHA01916.1 hypothetical protein [Nocardioides convexus]